MHRLAAQALRHPRATLAALAAASLFFAAGATRLWTDAGYRALLGAEHPAVREIDAFTRHFGGGLPFAVVWGCAGSTACQSVFDPRALRMAHDLARRLEGVPGVLRVDGPATSPLLFPEPLGLPVARRLAPEGEPARDLEALAARALRDPIWVGQLVSPDGRAGALVVHLESSAGETAVRALAALDAALAPFEAQGFEFQRVGGPVEFVVAGDELNRNAARLVPAMVGLVALALLVAFRSLAAALLALGSVGLAMLWTLGLQGWLGWPRTSLTQVLAPLVLVIGVCDAIHLLTDYAGRAAARPPRGRGERAARLLEVTGAIGGPCFLSNLTTAAGFGSFAASRLESFVRFGWLAAAGVGFALVLCFTLLPIATTLLPPGWLGRERPARAWGRALERLVSFSERRARAILLASALAGAFAALGYSRLEVDARFEDLYGEQSRVVRWARAAADLLREPETLEIAIDPPSGEAPASLAALRALARLESLADLPGLARPLSILDPLRELHQLVHRGPLSLGDPGAQARVRSLLRLLALEDPQLVRLFVSPEDGALRLSLQAAKLPQGELRALLAEVRARAAADLPPGYRARVTGPLAVVAALIDDVQRTQLETFALAGALVLALVALHFRSWRAAALTFVPTGLPVLLTLGAMGLLGIPLDVGSAMVAAVVLGLSDDNAIHLLSAYGHGRRGGAAPGPAIAAAVRAVGRALVTSSLALAAGFLLLALAPWQTLASFGLLSAIAILVGLAAALVVLPALLVSLPGRASAGSPAPSR